MIYAGNAEGVLQYDGVDWKLIRHPERKNVHALTVGESGTVFVGCFGDIGWLRPNAASEPEFISLLEQVPEEERDFGRLRDAVTAGQSVIFSSGSHVLRWLPDEADPGGGTMTVWTADEGSRFTGLSVVGDRVFLDQQGAGLTALVGDEFRLAHGGETFADMSVRGVVEFDEERLLVVTKESGLFLLGEESRPLVGAANDFAERGLTGVVDLPNGGFALSGVSGELAILSRVAELERVMADGSPWQHGILGRGFVDAEGGLWLPLAFGLVRVDVGAGLEFFDDELGLRGAITSIVRHDGALYVGTTVGLFVARRARTEQDLTTFERVAGPEAAWALGSVRGALLVASSNGFFQVAADRVETQWVRSAVRSFSPSVDEDLVYLGSADGLTIFRWRRDGWIEEELTWTAPGTPYAIGPIVDDALWVVVAVPNGGYRVVRAELLDSGLPSGEVHLYDPQSESVSPHMLYPFYWNGQVLLGSAAGLHRYDAATEAFVIDPALANAAGETDLPVIAPTVDPDERLWFVADTHLLARAELDANDGVELSYPLLVDAVRQYRTVFAESGTGSVWIGASDGRLVRRVPDRPSRSKVSSPLIRAVSASTGETVYGGTAPQSWSAPELAFSNRTLRIEYAYPRYAGLHVPRRFQSRMVGLNDAWSEWTEETYREYAALREGRYRFEVRTEDDHLRPTEPAVWTMRVVPPWHRAAWAYGLYVLVGAGTIIGVVRWRLRASRRRVRELQVEIEERRRAEENFAKAFHSSPDAITITTLEEGRFLEVNESFLRVSGYAREEVLGRSVEDLGFFGAEERRTYLETVGESGRDLEWDFPVKSGAVRTGLVAVEEIRFAGQDCRLSTIRDITERKEAEREKQRAFQEVQRLTEELERERDYLREEISSTMRFGEIVGTSLAIKKVIAQIEAVASTDATVLILGESGVGKELVARAIHKQSSRASATPVRLNCASIPRELFESELFGHVRGAFTGANRSRVGRFELADRGTLFLDEIGELPLELQAKLLRVLQEGEFERVGENVTRRVDVRLIAATNRDLDRATRAGEFRSDLYYRLNVFPIEVPPLRERPADIVPLASHFLSTVCRELGREPLALSTRQAEQLTCMPWRGNARELRYVIERAVILSGERRLRLELALPEAGSQTSSELPSVRSGEAFVTAAEMRRRERENLLAALEHAGWKIAGPNGAASLLDLPVTTLRSRMQKMGLERPSRRG